MARVLILSRVVEQCPEAIGRLVEHGCSIIDNPEGSRIGRDALARLVEGADALIVGTQPIDARLLDRARALKIIVKAGAGLDNIDLDAAAERGIRVASTPGANAEAVADYTFGLLLAVARRIVEADRSVREGRWERFVGVDVHSKTLGIVGLGHVGKGVARRALGFGMRVLAVDIRFDEDFLRAHPVTPVSLERALREADFVTLHTPLLRPGGRLLTRERIALLKPGAILINTARGELVDERALYEALRDGRLAGAGLDVFEEEPPCKTPLRELPSVVLSPHNASYSQESMVQVATAAVDTLLGLLRDGLSRR